MTIALWYLWLEVLGAIGFVLAWRFCRALPDRGWCAAKTLGVLMIGLFSWWGYALGLLRNTSAALALAVFALAALAMLAATAGNRWPMGVRGGGGSAVREIAFWVKRHWRFVVTVEVLTAVAFLGWCLVRANDPAADHTEEPMDLMLLVAVSSSDSFPPADPWLAGYPISYYYMGYWLLGALGRLVGTPPEITYNLGQATWYALLVVGVFGLAFDLAAFSRRRDAEQRSAPSDDHALDPDRVGMRGGLIAALLVCFSANLALPVEWGRRLLQGTGSAWAEATASLRALFLGASAANDSPAAALWSENWWWWRSSRVVQDTELGAGTPIEIITEFPFFSYLLGDNHPHVLAMPVVVAVLTLAFAWFASAAVADPSRAPRLGLRGGALAYLGLAAVAGSIVAINTWDLVGVWTIVVLAVAAAAAAGSALGERWRRALLAAVGCSAVLVLGSALLYLPYHLTASSQVKGILPNFFHPTRLGQVLLMFATLLPGLVLLLLDAWRSSDARPRLALAWWLGLLGASVAWLLGCVVLARLGPWSELVARSESGGGLVAAVLSRWSGGWLTLALSMALLALLIETLRARWSSPVTSVEAGVDFALLLAATGVALIAAPELVYLHDSFGNRMNTVFKLWYQAWLLLAVAGAVGLAAATRRRGGPRTAACLGLALIALGLFYPIAALWSKTGGFGADHPTLDSLAWLRSHHAEELEAMHWVRTSTATRDVVVQRSGGSYRAEENLPSVVTGRATLLGWGGHEFQWRGSAFSTYAAGREEALERMYRPPSAEDLQKTLLAWNVDYLYVGPQERSRYEITAADDSIYGAAMDLAFENPQVRIYRRRG